MKIVADRDISHVAEYFQDVGELVLLEGRSIHAEHVRDADVLLVRAVTKVNAELLAGSKVKFVGSMTAGADHLDTKWLDEQNIIYRTTPGFNAASVADYVVCVIAVLQRRMFLAQHGARAAVIGVGHVGSLVAKRLEAIGMEVVLCDPLRAQNENDFNHTPFSEINNVDFISLHVPLTHDGEHVTYRMIDKVFLEKQKVGCALLNASRGAVLKIDDLLPLQNVMQICFDVYEDEPSIEMDTLNQLAIATPHIAGYSVQAKRRGIVMLYQNLLDEKLITKPIPAYLDFPRQHIEFAGEKHHWQDIVMGIFNPLLMTTIFKEKAFREDNSGDAFDALRRAFDYRHEFSFVDVVSQCLLLEDKQVLQGLGINAIETSNP